MYICGCVKQNANTIPEDNLENGKVRKWESV